MRAPLLVLAAAPALVSALSFAAEPTAATHLPAPSK